MRTPFCQWVEADDNWTCSACGAVVPKTVSQDRPFAACRVGSELLGIDPDRPMTRIVNVTVYAHAHGPGTELKRILKVFGIVPKAGCSCNDKAVQMNAWGVDGCEERLEEIVGWLQDEAKSRGLPFVKTAARILVRRAISNARARLTDVPT